MNEWNSESVIYLPKVAEFSCDSKTNALHQQFVIKQRCNIITHSDIYKPDKIQTKLHSKKSIPPTHWVVSLTSYSLGRQEGFKKQQLRKSDIHLRNTSVTSS